ncbi:alpha/beta hydrolase [Rhodococcus sp. IEGM 1381]|uniref:alpha/beta hydrolase n=1 Tax=Rhodococcus sp. IEGM 1381 TaxID=3047085 RepID=UPI0024B71F57|nr:alpha/beta hydrolase [Rhodococcus sp. IEGM 1381]MDI9896856.1 alpha/beta hydrolase [Rhodococcus sp. IEGM 1381]
MIVDNFQRIPYEPARDGRVEMHSGLSRHYPTLHANFVADRIHNKYVGILMVHPTSDFLSHFLLRGFAEARLPIMGLNTRYSSNEPALLMERAIADVGAGVRWLKNELGFEKVVLLGFSGGGSLSTYYQEQAENPTADIDGPPLVPADGLMLVGAHTGRAQVLRHWIDASVTDELDPTSTDPDLDLYAPDRPSPLDREWVTRYRAAQLARIERIDEWAIRELDSITAQGASDRAFVVHRTVADPRFVDITLDPSDRQVGSMYGDPERANTSAGGLARFVSVRSWLSTWSSEYTGADAIKNLPNIAAPTLIVSLLGDQAAFAQDSRAMHAASPDSTLIELRDLNHYLVDQPHGIGTVTGECRAWIEKNL